MAAITMIERVDHLVLTVADIEVTNSFYKRALGFEPGLFRGPQGQPRHALIPDGNLVEVAEYATQGATAAV